MGVRGLTTYIDAHPYLSKPYKLHDTKIVIDGKNLLHFLYESKEIDFIHGGEYKRYAAEMKKYLTRFKECNIEPIIVFGGGNEAPDYKFHKKIRKFKRRLKQVKEASLTGKCDESFLPILSSEVFKSIISEMGIPFVQCDNKCDSQVAALANHYECPVLSDDSDFYIYDIKQGFIRFSHIDECVTTVLIDKDTGMKYLNCFIYNVDSFLYFNKGLEKSSLSLFATLVGNDFLTYDHLKPFHDGIHLRPRQRIDGILEWVRDHQRNEAEREILDYIQEENKEEMKLKIKVSIESYELGTTKLANIIDNKSNYVDELLLISNLVAPCGTLLPEKFIISYNQGRLPGYFVSIINLHRLFLSPQVEELEYKSSYDCSRYLRRLLYGVLLTHDAQNPEVHNNICKQNVTEYDHCNGKENIVKVEPIFYSHNGIFLPKLSEIYYMKKDIRQNLLTDIMEVKKIFLLSFSPDLQLLFGIIIYWLRNCSPKPIKEFFLALILCIIHFYVLQESIVEPKMKIIPNKEADEYFSVLESISVSEKQSIVKQISKYLATSTTSSSNSFKVTVVHSYSQIQTCLRYLISLNNLLDFPFNSPRLHEMIDGTVLHNLTKHLIESPRHEIFLENLLGRNTACKKLFDMMINKVLSNIPKSFIWNRVDYRIQSTQRKSDRNASRNTNFRQGNSRQ